MKIGIFSPCWSDYLPTFSNAELGTRIKSLDYHLATLLTPQNMVNSLKFEEGRERIKNFYSHDFDWQRSKMIEIVEKTIDIPHKYAQAVGRAKRHEFVRDDKKILSYWNGVSWISGLNGITPPWFCAYGANLLDLKKGKRVLVVGFGHGYASAVFSESMKNEGEIYAIDMDEKFLNKGKKIIEKLNYTNFRFKLGDGIQGWGEREKFDAIWPTLSTLKIPPRWINELKEGGRLCIFRPLTEDELNLAFSNEEFREGFQNKEVYFDKWWQYVCLGTYLKEDGKLVEVSRFYDLFNPPFHNDEYGISMEREWSMELGRPEKILLEFLKTGL